METIEKETGETGAVEKESPGSSGSSELNQQALLYYQQMLAEGGEEEAPNVEAEGAEEEAPNEGAEEEAPNDAMATAEGAEEEAPSDATAAAGAPDDAVEEAEEEVVDFAAKMKVGFRGCRAGRRMLTRPGGGPRGNLKPHGRTRRAGAIGQASTRRPAPHPAPIKRSGLQILGF